MDSRKGGAISENRRRRKKEEEEGSGPWGLHSRIVLSFGV